MPFIGVILYVSSDAISAACNDSMGKEHTFINIKRKHGNINMTWRQEVFSYTPTVADLSFQNHKLFMLLDWCV